MIHDEDEIEAGTVKLTTEDGQTFFRKGDQIYDAEGNHANLNEIRGRILGGTCGHPTCSCIGARWRDSSLDSNPLVCDACANEKNERALRMRVALPCNLITGGA